MIAGLRPACSRVPRWEGVQSNGFLCGVASQGLLEVGQRLVAQVVPSGEFIAQIPISLQVQMNVSGQAFYQGKLLRQRELPGLFDERVEVLFQNVSPPALSSSSR